MIGSSITSTWLLTAAVCLTGVAAPQVELWKRCWESFSCQGSFGEQSSLSYVSAKRIGQVAKSQQEPASDEPPMRVKPRRLPTYYSRVVTQKQRDEIYSIQDRFDVEIQALQEQIDAKTKDRDREVEGVLDPEQLDEVRRLTAEALKRREDRRSGATEGTGVPATGSGDDGSGDN